jgi:diguanylate cyclase (GGDEF)-like protein
LSSINHSFLGLHCLLPASMQRFLSGAVMLCALTLLVSALPSAAALRFDSPWQNTAAQNEISGVNAIVQDQYGFIWIGGENGLSRYDGQTTRLYQAREDDDSLPSSFVWDLAVDHANVLWVATSNGLSFYEASTEKFIHFTGVGDTPFPTDTISAIKVDAANNIYAGGLRGLYRIDAARNKIDVFFPDPPLERAISAERLRDLNITPDGNVWIATLGMGVVIFDPATETFEYLVHRPGDDNSLISNQVKTIEQDSAGNMWIGTYGAGISIYNPHTDRFRHIGYHETDPTGLRSSVVWKLFRDSEGTMWVTLDQGGLARYDAATGTFAHFLHDPYDPGSVASNQLRAILEDANRDLWIGAFPSGISYLNRSKQVFRTYQTRFGDPTSLSNNAVTALHEDEEGLVWVGTEGGLNVFDPEQRTFTQFRAEPQNPDGLLADAILAVMEDSAEELWVGTWAGGLHRLDRTSGTFTRYLPETSGVTSRFIWDIVEDRNQNLWIGTEDGGLNLYQRASDTFISIRNNPADEQSLASDFVWSLLAARDGYLWVGMFTALNRLAPGQGYLRQFPAGAKDGKSLSSKNIRSLYEDSRGLIWIGTLDRGASIFNPADQSFRYLDIHEGLPSSAVASVLEDDRGNMWLATANGLTHVEYPSLKVTTYRKEHGLAGSNYNRDASVKDRHGNLYFGSTEGLTVFHPDDLVAQEQQFQVHLTDFRILNQKVPVGPDSPLKTSIVEAREIQLAASDIMFSFDFVALNYRNPSASRYAYKLEGFDRDWIDINAQTMATYTNIDPGRYRLRVRATNGNGVWFERDPALTVIVNPPLWRTWWAYLGYALLLMIAWYLRREHRRLREKAEVYRAQSLTDSLTQVYNREGIAQIARKLFAASGAPKQTAVMLIDIDHFKKVNDQRGHDAGDIILKSVAQVLQHNVRHGDSVGRWGGEEFILLCPDTSATAAQVVAEKIRCAVADHLFEIDTTRVKITISIGVAITAGEEPLETTLKRADVALYKAKSLGRNCVCFAQQ